MLTNKDILAIVKKNDEYTRKLEVIDAAKYMCKYFKDSNAEMKLQEEYDKMKHEYEKWLNQEVKHDN